MQKEIADRRISFGNLPEGELSSEFRDAHQDDPTIVEVDSAGARSTMTRATDIEQRASEWLISRESGHFTADMQTELDRWLLNARHRVTFLRLAEAWRRASRVRAVRPLDGKVDPDLLKNTDLTLRARQSNSGTVWPFCVAAGAALALIFYLIGSAGWSTLGPATGTKYTTSIGGYEHIALADGSGIQLNTDSEVVTRVTQQRREIQLLRGEALIRVEHDATRPFTVKAANVTVQADPAAHAATTFVMRMRATGGVDVSVSQGSVDLRPSNGLIDAVLRQETAFESTLAEGEMAVVRTEGVHLTRVGLEELNRKLSWTAGLLSFRGETLAEVTDEFNRYNRKHLVVTDATIASRRIGGAFQATDPESFVSALRKGFGVRADEQLRDDSGDGVIRLTRAN
jgi:transmembrane sensor